MKVVKQSLAQFIVALIGQSRQKVAMYLPVQISASDLRKSNRAGRGEGFCRSREVGWQV